MSGFLHKLQVSNKLSNTLSLRDKQKTDPYGMPEGLKREQRSARKYIGRTIKQKPEKKIKQKPEKKIKQKPENRKEVHCRIRALRFASFRGLMTVEAAIIVPVFLMAVFSILNVMHMAGVQEQLLSILANTASETAVYAYDEDSYSTVYLQTVLYANLLSSDLDFDRVSGRKLGISIADTEYDSQTGEIKLSASGQVLPLFQMFQLGEMEIAATAYTRAFIGGKMFSSDTDTESDEDVIVYVTTNGTVYHTTTDCTYLSLSVREVSISSVAYLRSADGSKYYACELCAEDEEEISGTVYITTTGNRYHTSKQCSGLKRTITAVKLSECSLPACSKCAE